MPNLLEKTRKITSILQRSVDSLETELPYNTMASRLADIIDCNACIINGGGTLLGYAMKYKTNTDRVEEFLKLSNFQILMSKQLAVSTTLRPIFQWKVN